MSLNLAALNEAIAAAMPDRAALAHGEKRLTFRDLTDRTRRVANFLLSRGITLHTERSELKNWESGQNHVALYLHNSPEYLEAMLGAFKARAVPFNVNYRYVGEELLYLFTDASPKVIIYQGRFARALAEVLPQVLSVELLIQVDDGSGAPLLPSAHDYETVLNQSSPDKPAVDLSPDDIYCTYTGGTTGMPKGVLWRQADSIFANLGGRYPDGSAIPETSAFVARATKSGGRRVMPAPPFMHGAGCQVALAALCAGNTVVIQQEVSRLDVADLLRTIEAERIDMFLIIGDAFGRPLVGEARANAYDLSSVRTIFSSGAILSPPVKEGLLDLMPQARIIDALGSSETGPQAIQVSTHDSHDTADARFELSEDSVILNEDRSGILEPGHDGFGWLAKRGVVPLGYLGDESKTKETFPEIGGTRYVVCGDRVRLLADGEIEFHGRESFTINSGGEKIFAEEVERAIKRHSSVADVVVTGRPSKRWGNEVVAIVELEPGRPERRQELLEEAAKHIAGYKLPKAFLFIDTVQRGASGKTDSRWAQSVADRAT